MQFQLLWRNGLSILIQMWTLCSTIQICLTTHPHMYNIGFTVVHVNSYCLFQFLSKQKTARKQKRIRSWYCKPNQKTIIGKLIVFGRKDFNTIAWLNLHGLKIVFYIVCICTQWQILFSTLTRKPLFPVN